ncbi:Uncharacterised protein [Streptococcus constellatus]|uniref:Uncharacterized protein n=1 Tax=Streptococcus constellatus TaxID=76860 RepID=A0A564S8F2_STRCV|nr:Uncharacterised protein [Streptococcus constellatus]VUX08369.1 Uncharacterised protein [Streptococcus gordonii]
MFYFKFSRMTVWGYKVNRLETPYGTLGII